MKGVSLIVRPLLRFLGRLLLVLGAAQLVPTAVCIAYSEGTAAFAFVGTALLTVGSGIACVVLGRGGKSSTTELYRREGILIVVAGWVMASAFGALPYILTGTVTNPVDALFESASGFTTTGASILTEIESNGRGILFWRSFTQWLGGMGIIVLFVALLPELGAGARFLYKLEVPGPTAETLHPRVHDTASVLWKLYLLLTAVQTSLLMMAGLDLYDALTHTFSTLSTGGFSPLNASAAGFSPSVHLILIVFMVLAGANFSLYCGLHQRRGWRNLIRDRELRFYLGLLATFSSAIALNLVWSGDYTHVSRAVLDGTFQVVSIVTTTGFATADFDLWPNWSRILLVGLMFVGGCAGSTAGGMKIMRLAIGLKSAAREVKLMFSPSSVVAVFIGDKAVPEPVVRSVVGFIILYFLAFGLGVGLLTAGGVDLETSATASIATLGNIGPGLHAVGPTGNFAGFASFQKLVMVLLMWLGRLEVYAIASLFAMSFWRR
ncbi:MAG: TrkH family potassium uptake protein [Thermoanaerobaculia bacterium]|nr:TrkH family potassium uptake protein [Thermoanaerobaculia bacterium]